MIPIFLPAAGAAIPSTQVDGIMYSYARCLKARVAYPAALGHIWGKFDRACLGHDESRKLTLPDSSRPISGIIYAYLHVHAARLVSDVTLQRPSLPILEYLQIHLCIHFLKMNERFHMLRMRIVQRLVKCPEIKARYGFRGRMASGRSEREYNDELSRHALTHFLNLVLFLDRAKVRWMRPWLGSATGFSREKEACSREDDFFVCWSGGR